MKSIYCIIFLLTCLSLVAQKPDSTRIMVTNATEPVLYKDCENWINIDVSDICKANTNVIYRSSDAIISQINGRSLNIIPTKGDFCHIEVFENDTLHFLGTKTLKTKYPPAPTVIVSYMNGKWIHRNDTVQADTDIFIQLVPDATFAKLCPNDVKYEISRIEIYIQKGLQPPTTISRTIYSGKDANKGIIVHIPDIILEDSLNHVRMGLGLEDFVRISASHKRISLSYWGMKGDNLFEGSVVRFLLVNKPK